MKDHGGLDRVEGKRVLVIEDRFLLADDLKAMLNRFGAEVVGPVSTLEQALETARTARVDAALVDIDLRGATAFAAADLLAELGVPFAFATGYDRALLPEKYRDRPFLAKPLTASRLRRALGELLTDRQPAR